MESGRILGQNHIIKHFENAIKMGKISHAYIINGEAGSGKMKLAVHFAKALQCEANNPDFLKPQVPHYLQKNTPRR